MKNMLEFKRDTADKTEISEMISAQRITSEKLCYLFIIFMLGCFVGWVYEEIFYWFTEGMLRNRALLYGPWLPIYGVGALGIYALKPIKRNPVLLFALCIAVSGVVEYIIGFTGIHLFGMRLWDYRGLFLNIGGIICFRSVISFGIMGLVFHYILEPMGEKLYAKLKTQSSDRVLDIPDFIFEEILRSRNQYEKNKNRRSKKFQDLNYICCSSYGRPRSMQYHFEPFKEVLKKSGLPNIRWHDLRHSYATLLMKNDFNLKAISKILGHAKEIVTADIYVDNREIITDGVAELKEYMEEVIPEKPVNFNETEKVFDHSDVDITAVFCSLTA